MSERTGVWLIGARGSIAAVTIAGHAALCAGAERQGLVTERADFKQADLLPLESMVFGGHEIRKGPLIDQAREVLTGSGLPMLATHTAEVLNETDTRIRPGVIRGGGKRIASMADDVVVVESDAEAINQIRADLDAFKAETGVTSLVVVNLASTEPTPPTRVEWSDLTALRAAIADGHSALPASSLYAYATLDGGDAYVNFTPSIGTRLPALEALAIERGTPHVGSDGKTGETLVKSVLAELFVRRNLPVLSWFGQNILGNRDGLVLDEPENKATKIQTKDQLLPKILGYTTESRVGIDYVESLGEWKIAWDHIHFSGFLGGRMSLQFTWNGCDSLLAAPLVLDLVRLIELAKRRGESGIITAMSPFFKDPMGTDEQRLISQDNDLLAWLKA